MKTLLISIFSIAALVLSPVHATASSDTELELRILPIDCIFEIINDGSGEIVYLTPEECGQFLDDDPGATPPSRGEGADSPRTPRRGMDDAAIGDRGDRGDRESTEDGESGTEEENDEGIAYDEDGQPIEKPDRSMPLSLAGTPPRTTLAILVIGLSLMTGMTYLAYVWHRKKQ